MSVESEPKSDPKPQCLIDGCEEEARWKGICGRCYHQAKTLIKEGKTTWEELADLRLCVEPEKKLLTAFRAKKSGT